MAALWVPGITSPMRLTEPIPPAQRPSSRIVVQRIQADEDVRFRVVAYENDVFRGLSEFGTAQELREALHRAAPGLQDDISEQLAAQGTHIVFDINIELNDAQRAVLRLPPGSAFPYS